MGFPSDKELKVMRSRLEKADPSRALPSNASNAEKLKYKLCQKFVIYLQENQLTQVALAKKLNVDQARVSEIVKYKIDLFTIDKLLNLADRLKLNIRVNVA